MGKERRMEKSPSYLNQG